MWRTKSLWLYEKLLHQRWVNTENKWFYKSNNINKHGKIAKSHKLGSGNHGVQLDNVAIELQKKYGVGIVKSGSELISEKRLGEGG